MSNREDSDIDDDFADLYKEYTGPVRATTTSVPETTKTSKRSRADSDEEEQETLDPNAVPTDFTSREAKVWEAKSKATERNWKKRTEEEMICKICGDSSHFTQGCPSTLGASRKSQDLFERVPARDPQVKALFTDRVVKNIEKDIGCKIKIEEKFIIVSAKEGHILSKGVDAVHKIKNEGVKTGEFNSNMVESDSRSPKGRISVAPKVGPADSPRSNPSPRNVSNYDQRSGRHDKVIKEHVREEFQKYPRGSPQARAYRNDGIQIRSTRSKSPARRPPYSGGSYDLKDNHKCGPGLNLQPTHKEGRSTFSLALEELELEYTRDAMDIAKFRDKEEDEENYRHRKAIEEIRGIYMKKLATIREMHAKQWEEFLRFETNKRQPETRQEMPNVGFGGYRNNNHYDYGDAAAAGNPYINNMQMESRSRHPEIDNYPSLRPGNNYNDFQRQRHEDYGEAYNRY
ncbi:putative transcription factor interactor and regulator CCHC(Zn) family [Helianthus anomalus]